VRLIIGNRNYSSWSLRAWLVAQRSGLPFEALRIALYREGAVELLREHCPAALVPVLEDGEVQVWDSLAIAEYLAEASWRRGVAQYIRLLAGQADIRGIDIGGSGSPLVQ